MKRTDSYTGPFPRKRHSHRCKACETRGQINSVACYKSRCTKAQLVEHCGWCGPAVPTVTHAHPVRVIPAAAAVTVAPIAAALPVGAQLDLFGGSR